VLGIFSYENILNSFASQHVCYYSLHPMMHALLMHERVLVQN
jgi:hypothetical protein